MDTHNERSLWNRMVLVKAIAAPWASILVRCIVAPLLLTVAAAGHSSETLHLNADQKAVRQELAIGYSQLYQESDGIPKLKWILMFKDQPEEMGRVTSDLLGYYAKLAATMEKLSKRYPAMRIDEAPMSKIESDTRKAMGEDLAKDMVPLIGKSGVKFEREALLAFYDLLNEQRHLAGVMVDLETNPALKKFLATTKGQLDERYAKVGALLNRRYFTQ